MDGPHATVLPRARAADADESPSPRSATSFASSVDFAAATGDSASPRRPSDPSGVPGLDTSHVIAFHGHTSASDDDGSPTPAAGAAHAPSSFLSSGSASHVHGAATITTVARHTPPSATPTQPSDSSVAHRIARGNAAARPQPPPAPQLKSYGIADAALLAEIAALPPLPPPLLPVPQPQPRRVPPAAPSVRTCY